MRRPQGIQPDAGRLHGRMSGRVRLVAKGARSKRSNLKALRPFTPLLLRYSGRGVKTPAQHEAVSLALAVSGVQCSGLYINELLAYWVQTLLRTLFDYHGTVFRRWREPTARLNRRYDVSNWRCWVIWGMASFTHCASGGERVDDTA